MEREKTVEIFDTTLRDGTQAAGVNVSTHDKLVITERLDEFGIDIIEGGWPGSNPKDKEFFSRAKKLQLKNAQLCAFGSTARAPDKICEDKNLNMLIEAETEIVSIFGKSWRLHSKEGLGLSDEMNAELIYNSVLYLKEKGRTVVFDAEHFFDGYKDDGEFALKMLMAAQQGGADVIVLCDTNGGSLPHEIEKIVREVREKIHKPVGIHAHNDTEMAVANSLAAIRSGAVHVQGTINGVGERCGNANLCSVLPNLFFKMNMKTRNLIDLKDLYSLSHFVYETLNLVPNSSAPYVGKSAFTHKGGIHVSSVLKNSRMYEHIPPAAVGNKQHAVISDLSGKSNVRYKAEKLGIKLPDGKNFEQELVQHIKNLEYAGFQFDGADASFELLLRQQLKKYSPFFQVIYAKVNVMFNAEGEDYAEAVLKVKVGDEIEHTAADGNGPVNALDNALKKALLRFYPEIAEMDLIDYKVRVLGEKNGTGARVRVLVESGDGANSWSTVGVSHNIIKASLQALNDSINYKIFRVRQERDEVAFGG